MRLVPPWPVGKGTDVSPRQSPVVLLAKYSWRPVAGRARVYHLSTKNKISSLSFTQISAGSDTIVHHFHYRNLL